MSENKFYGIEKLNEDNYYNWKFKMKMYLVKEGLWSVIEEAAQQTDAWNKKDMEAFAIISLCVEDCQLIHIRNEKTAKDAWNSLQSQHERVTLSSKVSLMRRICSMHLSEGDNMKVHINTMMELFDKLRAIGSESFTEDWKVSMILSSLPPSYDSLITALEVRPDKDLTMDMVKGKLMEEYRKKDDREALPEISAFKTTRNSRKPDGKSCYFCKKTGHLKYDCIKYHEWCKKNKKFANVTEANKDDEDQEAEYVLMTASGGEDETVWIVDSGASCHIAQDKKLFYEIDCNSRSQSISVANGNCSQSQGKGVCKIKTNSATLNVTDVYFVPDFNSNLLSVRKITEKGYRVSFYDKECIIEKNCKIVCKASLKNGLYVLDATTEKVMSAENCNKGCIHYWHRVLGHHNEEDIKKLIREDLVANMKMVECKKLDTPCEACLQGKLSRSPFPKESRT